jgi:hypothetical protein
VASRRDPAIIFHCAGQDLCVKDRPKFRRASGPPGRLET